MRIITQTALDASVTIESKEVAHISKGLLLLVSFTYGDDLETIDKMINKLVGLRIYPDENGKTNLSLKDVDAELLSVSQFTLYASVKEGRRPSFTSCLRPEEAKELYEIFNAKLKETGLHVETGVFGADMQVKFTNDGPFTLILDSKELFNR